ncbi:MAG: hypothetical protein QX189_04715 [Methylococcales bacterium]
MQKKKATRRIYAEANNGSTAQTMSLGVKMINYEQDFYSLVEWATLFCSPH